MAKKSIEEKIQDEYPEFYSEVCALSVTDLEARLLNNSKAREEVLDQRDNPEPQENKVARQIEETKQELKVLTGPFNDAINELKLKSGFLAKLIKEKGGK